MKVLASLLATAAVASLAACADTLPSAPSSSFHATGAATRSVSATGRLSSPLVNAASGQCLTTANQSSSIVTPATVAACNGGAAQSLDLPAGNTSGVVYLFGGSVCLDDFGAQARVGDVVGIYTCVSGAPTQIWTLAANGSLVGPNGLCVAAGATGANLTLQSCDGSAGQRWSVPSANSTTSLVNAASAQCLGTSNGSSAIVTPAALAKCAGTPDQTLSVPAVGVAGQVLFFNGTLCLDDFGAAGRAGDVVGIYTCVPGAPTQQWTLTSAGSLTGVNGLCVGASGTGITLQGCDGSAGQRWSTGTPASPQPSAPSTGAAAVFALMGAVPNVASVQAHGGVWARYENDFATYAESHWTSDGASYDLADYYDRAMIYYVWWARTGNAVYLDRANQLAIQARTYMESVNYYPQPYLMMIDGVALHALVTGDQHSLEVVGKVADQLMTSGSYWSNVMGNTSNPDMDSRTQARLLGVLLDAAYLHAPTAYGNDWSARLHDALAKILGSQSPDGAYRWASQCSFNKPFMVGMLNDALIRYYTAFEADARIVPAVKRSVDYMWANEWLPGSQAFTYIDATCSIQSQTPYAATDLNNLIVSGFGFVGKQTGDASYFSKGDAIFSGSVVNAWLDGSKQFNQEYTSSYRYLGLRW